MSLSGSFNLRWLTWLTVRIEFPRIFFSYSRHSSLDSRLLNTCSSHITSQRGIVFTLRQVNWLTRGLTCCKVSFSCVFSVHKPSDGCDHTEFAVLLMNRRGSSFPYQLVCWFSELCWLITLFNQFHYHPVKDRITFNLRAENQIKSNKKRNYIPFSLNPGRRGECPPFPCCYQICWNDPLNKHRCPH